jgi:transcriptional regulator with XRE-family HTH domain
MNAELLGQNIARLRRQKRWTQRELAESLHTDHSMVTRWEKGKVLPRPDTLERLAQALGVSIDDLTLSLPLPSSQLFARLEDPELAALLHQVDVLDQRDREALKAVLEAMLTRSRLREMVAPTHVSKQAS